MKNGKVDILRGVIYLNEKYLFIFIKINFMEKVLYIKIKVDVFKDCI